MLNKKSNEKLKSKLLVEKKEYTEVLKCQTYIQLLGESFSALRCICYYYCCVYFRSLTLRYVWTKKENKKRESSLTIKRSLR